MARVSPILRALSRVVRRDVSTFGPAGFNNFFFFIALMLWAAAQSGVEPKSSYPLLLFVLVVLLFPLSADPLDKVPPSRLDLWPITTRQRIELRVVSILLSPVLWIAAGLIFFKRIRPAIAIAFLTALIGVQVIATAGRSLMARVPRGRLLKIVPEFPGRLGGLVRHHMRQQFQVLDIYIAMIFSLGACAYRGFAPSPEPEAFPILAMLVALALSTYSQCLFGLDRASSAMTRYRLLPLHGWEVLLAKDLAFLGMLSLLVLPLDPLPGLTFGLFALGVGHHAAVFDKMTLRRWRFAGGRVFIGVVQCVGGFMLGVAVHRVNPAFVVSSVVIWAGSLVIYGSALGRKAA